jgi:hydroxyacylglutathione hydrolase
MPDSTIGYELRYNQSLKHIDSEQQFVESILDGQPEPPAYFSRMKRDNKEGPPLLGELPAPQNLEAGQIAKLALREDAAVVDTRHRLEFMKGHLPGSLLAPYDRNFNTVTGSYITEEKTPVYLIIDKQQVRDAIIDLINIGLDDIRGYITPEQLRKYADEGGELEQIPIKTFKEIDLNGVNENKYILDVRKADEYNKDHIPGAINLAHVRLGLQLDEVPGGHRRDRSLVAPASGGGHEHTRPLRVGGEGLHRQLGGERVEALLAGPQPLPAQIDRHTADFLSEDPPSHAFRRFDHDDGLAGGCEAGGGGQPGKPCPDHDDAGVALHEERT